jgi:hypothetical protein
MRDASERAWTRADDPRTIITPDAFSVHPDLVGIPLAQHPRRVMAILVDLVLIALLTNAGGIVLGFLFFLFFLRMATRKKGTGQAPLAGAFRVVVGCMGAFILFVTVVVFLGLWAFRPWAEPPDGSRRAETRGAVVTGFSQAMEWWGEGLAYRTAATEGEAREAALPLAERLRVLEPALTDEDIRDLLRETAPSGAPWRDRIAGWSLDRDALSEDPPADLEIAPAEEGSEEVQEAAAEERTEDAAAPDPRLVELEAELARERRLRERAESRLERTRADLTEAREVRGVRAYLSRFAEDLGLGFGWGALYFSVFMTWWKGRTPGKRLFRLRVVRLDRGEITWWTALERYGGYAAGFATGLLGFIQVFWDSNRQATHDRIAGTVVVQDGKPPVPGRWRPLSTIPMAPRPAPETPKESP